MGISYLLLSCVLVAPAEAETIATPPAVVLPNENREPAPASAVFDGPAAAAPFYSGASGADPGTTPSVPLPPPPEPTTPMISPSDGAAGSAPSEPAGGSLLLNPALRRALEATENATIDPPPPSAEARRLTASELLADAMADRPGMELEGRGATLLELLGPVTDRAKRLRVAHAYWELVGQVAAHGVAVDEWELISRVQPNTSNTRLAQAAWGSAEAAAATARLNVTQSQYRLAEAVGLAGGSPLPLPADRPHIGAYSTRFESLFPSRSAPSRLRLIDRTLPIRASAIAIRVEAVHAAEDTLNASSDAYNEARLGLADVYAAIHEYGRQRRTLFASVRRYNDDIADYALAVAGPEVRGRELVSILIEIDPAASGGASFAPGSPSGVKQAEYRELLDERPPKAAGLDTPTPAARPGEPSEASQRPIEHTTLMQIVPAEALNQTGTSYSGLVDKESAVRSKHVAMYLHRSQDPSARQGQPIKLSQCLEGPAADQRARVIGAYWLVCQKAAAQRALVDRVDALEALTPATYRALDRTEASGAGLEPFGDGGGLALHAAQKAAQAAARESQVELLESQYELTLAAGRPLDSSWLLPSTSPHAGHYALRLDSQPGQLAESWAVRRLAVTIPALAEALHARGDAIVDADSLQGEATQSYAAALQPIGPLLYAINRKTDETLGFLETLTAYNQAIAEYVLTVLPANMPGEELVATMVIE